jgi:hypothetical protein
VRPNMGIIKTFDTKKLPVYRKRGTHLPGVSEKQDNINAVDPDLRPEEQAYVRHYLGYADVLLGMKGQDEENTSLPLPPTVEEPATKKFIEILNRELGYKETKPKHKVYGFQDGRHGRKNAA